jgi:DNA-directed RNA polymerase specialized sigma subunit
MPEKEFMSGNDRIAELMKRPGAAEAVAKIHAEAEELDRIYLMNLAMVREAGRRTQVAIAEQMNISQGAVSQLERRDDMLLSTLRSYLTATGAENPRILVTVNGVDVTLDI